MISYLTSIVSNIVILTVFEIYDAKSCNLDLGRSKAIQGEIKLVVSIDSPLVVSYSTSIDPIIVSVTIFEIFDV